MKSSGKQPAKPQPKPQQDSHTKAVREAHQQAAKPAGPAGNTFKYPIRMG